MTTPLDTVLAYHERSKHHFQRYAAGPGRLDWATQPDPFRTYAGSCRVPLPLLADDTLGASYVDVYGPGSVSPWPLGIAGVGALFELAFGLSAWKQYGGERWALRCNPSSGNLHPTEAYVVVQGCAGIADGVHHYVSRDHLFEQRCSFVTDARVVPADCVLVGLSSIYWREAWKYGERAYRYCQHDAGHAIAAVRYAAATLGWQARILLAWSDAAIAALLGLDRAEDFADAERESPDVLLLVSQQPGVSEPAADDVLVAPRRWTGKANRLSPQHAHQWPVIDEVAAACAKPPTTELASPPPQLPNPLPSACRAKAAAIIKQRRSAQAFDGVTTISAASFFRMLDMTLPRQAPPWDAIPWAPRVHLVVFVHRVEGLQPGLYLFLRHRDIETDLRAAFSEDFEWLRLGSWPEHLPLFRLVSADAGQAASALSCHQDIAADGAFSLGMLAQYADMLAPAPWRYRHLFWEAGILGQVLYLEAEAAGLRGTGIGCYFDDGVHELLALRNHSLQSVYHFTVGGALTDDRLQTLPPYAHLQRG